MGLKGHSKHRRPAPVGSGDPQVGLTSAVAEWLMLVLPLDPPVNVGVPLSLRSAVQLSRTVVGGIAATERQPWVPSLARWDASSYVATGRWLKVPVVPGQYGGVLTGVLGLLLLAVVRLGSERSLGGRKRRGRDNERRWSIVGSRKNGTRRDSKSRTMKQFVAETIWACGAGVMAAHWPP